ncbi:MAG: hypothetical protein RRA94_04090 [Bacteroidota bacterium]|nr:hypothetical protein [Bacteroidota bacterium]
MRYRNPLLLLVPAALLYLLTMPTAYVIGDPYDELQFVLSGDAVFRPHHLLTTLLYRGGALLLSWLPGTTALHLQALVILSALVALAGLLRIAQAGRQVSLLAGGLVAVAHAFWLHGSSIETGMPALAALVWSVHAALRSHRAAEESAGWRDSAAPGRWRMLSAALFSLSVLLHVQGVILLPALLILLLPAGGGRELREALARIGLTLIGCIGGAYLLIGVSVLGHGSPAALWAWVTTHHNQDSLAHLSGGIIAVARSLSGLLRLFVDIGSAGTVVRGILTGQGLASVGVQQMLQLGAAGLTVLAVGLWTWFGRRSRLRLTLAAAVAAVSLLAFNSFWLGSDPQFWLNLLPFLFPVMTAGMRTVRRQSVRRQSLQRFALTGLLALLLAANLSVREPSLLFPGGDAAHRRAELFAARHAGSTLLTPGSRWSSALISMEAPVRVRQMFKFERVEDMLSHCDGIIDGAMRRGDAVYVEGLEHVPPEMVGIWESVTSLFGVTREELSAHLHARYRLEEVVVRRSGDTRIPLFAVHEKFTVRDGSTSSLP